MITRISLCTIVWLNATLHLYSQSLSPHIIEIMDYGTRQMHQVIEVPDVYTNDWFELSQVRFWKDAMACPKDTLIVNTYGSRNILAKFSAEEWEQMSHSDKRTFIRQIKSQNRYSSSLIYTYGKADYYRFTDVIPQLEIAFNVFQEEGVDPWYAQAILMIESPGRLRYSPAGAYGPFQLMKSVAKRYGLKVDRYTDDRADLKKSAMAAASMLRDSYIPSVKFLMKRHRLSYDESDFWFKLLVLHTYHAGATNVSEVLNKINPRSGGQELITRIWNTSTDDFQSASQNYSQLALAAQLHIEELIMKDYHLVCKESKYDYLQLLQIW